MPPGGQPNCASALAAAEQPRARHVRGTRLRLAGGEGDVKALVPQRMRRRALHAVQSRLVFAEPDPPDER